MGLAANLDAWIAWQTDMKMPLVTGCVVGDDLRQLQKVFLNFNPSLPHE
jgi:hypothetical protein